MSPPTCCLPRYTSLYQSLQPPTHTHRFALFAAGVVRPKNTVSIFIKNFFDTCIAGIAFYLVGYAFAFGAKDGYTNGEWCSRAAGVVMDRIRWDVAGRGWAVREGSEPSHLWASSRTRSGVDGRGRMMQLC